MTVETHKPCHNHSLAHSLSPSLSPSLTLSLSLSPSLSVLELTWKNAKNSRQESTFCDLYVIVHSTYPCPWTHPAQSLDRETWSGAEDPVLTGPQSPRRPPGRAPPRPSCTVAVPCRRSGSSRNRRRRQSIIVLVTSAVSTVLVLVLAPVAALVVLDVQAVGAAARHCSSLLSVGVEVSGLPCSSRCGCKSSSKLPAAELPLVFSPPEF